MFAVGLAAYWEQFSGLRDRLQRYQSCIEERVGELGATVVSGGLVDSAESSYAAGDLFARERVELVLCYAATYATSSQVLPALQAAGVPVLLVALQPVPALDYEAVDTATWLANCSACCVPEMAGACTRAGIVHETVVGMIDGDDRAWSRIGGWLQAAGLRASLRGSRLGFLGHTYPGMLDLYTDFTAVQAQLGGHVEVLEIDDLVARVHAASESEVTAKKAEIRGMFEFADPGEDPIAAPIEPEELDWTARVAVGLQRLAEDFRLDGLTYYHRGVDHNDAERVAAAVIVGNCLLTAGGVVTSGEGDLKTNLAQLILDRLGAGGSFTEFYALDFDKDFILMGHDGPGHVAIAQERPVLRGLRLYHGKHGAGVSVEFQVRYGPVTILGCTQTRDGRLKLICAEGESLPGPTFHIGNTNSRLRFRRPPAEFLERWCAEGPTHHVALGIGHRGHELEQVAAMCGIEFAAGGR
ncbi:MAG: arabinose isomerase [Solirubrobacteraceae bacterium]